jgi:hypothetical protein
VSKKEPEREGEKLAAAGHRSRADAFPWSPRRRQTLQPPSPDPAAAADLSSPRSRSSRRHRLDRFQSAAVFCLRFGLQGRKAQIEP